MFTTHTQIINIYNYTEEREAERRRGSHDHGVASARWQRPRREKSFDNGGGDLRDGGVFASNADGVRRGEDDNNTQGR